MIPTSIDGTDITGATIDGTDVTEITVDGDVVFSARGQLLYVASNAQNTIETFELGTPFDLNTATSIDVLTNAGQNSSLNDMFISPDGSKMVVAEANDGLFQYNLSTNYEPSSRGSVQSSYTAENDGDGIGFSADGTNGLMGESKDNEIRHFTLSTPFDLSTIQLQSAFSRGTNPYDPAYVDSGNKVVFTDRSVFGLFDLSTPFDFSTRGSITTVSASSGNFGLELSDDGVNFLESDSFNNVIESYTLTTPYDISTRGSGNSTLSHNDPFGIQIL